MNIKEKIFLIPTIYQSADTGMAAQVLLRKDLTAEQVQFVMEQRNIHSKAQQKLPIWYTKQCFFTQKSLEQSTQPAVALAKANLFGKGTTFLSLTGGFGVDDWAACTNYERIIASDTDENLNEMVRYNIEQLGIGNYERLSCSAEDLIQMHPAADCYYIDPDRRTENSNKGLNTELFSPNVIKLLHAYNQIKTNCWIKLSPATDLTWIRQNIEHNADIYIIEYQHEVKEILVHIHPKQSANTLLIYVTNPKGHSIAVSNNMSFAPMQKLDYLFEPSPALIKSNWLANDHFCSMLNLNTLNNNATLLRSEWCFCSPIGKFKPVVFACSSLNEMKNKLAQLNIIGAGISCKSFYLKPDELRKKLNLKENANYQLYCTTNNKNNVFILAKN